MKLKNLENIVLEVLKTQPLTRSDDFHLVLRVYQQLNEKAVTKELFCEIMLYHNEYGLPSFESITRARRKVFEKYPELKPKKITELRAEKEKEFKEYAKNG